MEPITIAAAVIGLGAGVIVGRLTSGVLKAGKLARHWEARYRIQGRELAELRAWKSARLAPLKAANAKRKADRLAREAKAAELRNQRLTEMRELTGLV